MLAAGNTYFDAEEAIRLGLADRVCQTLGNELNEHEARFACA